jgi:hypothetical protein
VFVVELAGLQAVVQLAEEFVEQVSLGLAVPVSGGAAGIEVAPGARRGAQRCQCPERADGGQPAVAGSRCHHSRAYNHTGSPMLTRSKSPKPWRCRMSARWTNWLNERSATRLVS